MRFIHTADWQIGKPFKQFGDQEGVLRQARLLAIENIGHLAEKEGAAHVVVAGDIYDTEVPTPRTLLEPIERMRLFANVEWHLLPGNHDPHRPKGVWDRVRENGAPANVHLHLTPEPATLGSSAALLPAPLTRKSEGSDLTEWMDRAETAPGMIRIGVAHGSVVGFGSGGEAHNPVDPRRPERAGLAYLALGDWHRTMQVGPAIWYAGTPEPDRAGGQEVGRALVVDVPGPGVPAMVTPKNVGTYRWLTREEHLLDPTALEDMETRLRGLPELSSTILRLCLTGTLPLGGRSELDRRLIGIAAALFHLDLDDSRLSVRPTPEDLESIDFDGVLRRAADRLKSMMDDANGPGEKQLAEDALVQLFVMATGNGELGA
jgi:DNA repair exonuclease SbcCD nuclease subunit